jgi:hypothetical protein
MTAKDSLQGKLQQRIFYNLILSFVRRSSRQASNFSEVAEMATMKASEINEVQSQYGVT